MWAWSCRDRGLLRPQCPPGLKDTRSQATLPDWQNEEKNWAEGVEKVNSEVAVTYEEDLTNKKKRTASLAGTSFITGFHSPFTVSPDTAILLQTLGFSLSGSTNPRSLFCMPRNTSPFLGTVWKEVYRKWLWGEELHWRTHHNTNIQKQEAAPWVLFLLVNTSACLWGWAGREGPLGRTDSWEQGSSI